MNANLFSKVYSSFFKNHGFLFLFLLLGIGLGSAVAVLFPVFEDQTVFPLLFSGIPQLEFGFFLCFSTLLLNSLLSLLFLFFLGLTVFGFLAVPIFFFIKGFLIALGLFFFFSDSARVLEGVFFYAPAAAMSLLFLFWFSAHSLSFSEQMRKSLFSSSVPLSLENRESFRAYLGLFFRFLVCFMGVSFLAAIPAGVYSVLFS